MDDVRGDILGPPLDTTPAAIIANKIKLRSFKSRQRIKEKVDGPYRGLGYLAAHSAYEMFSWYKFGFFPPWFLEWESFSDCAFS